LGELGRGLSLISGAAKRVTRKKTKKNHEILEKRKKGRSRKKKSRENFPRRGEPTHPLGIKKKGW